MKNRIVAGMVVLLLIVGCAPMMSFEEREKIYGKETPVITETYASKQMNPGDTWKVYLKASDPDGDMESVVAIVHMVGSGTHPVSYTRIKDGNRKELSGYFSLITSNPSGDAWLNNLTLTLTVQIKDRAGHLSKAVTFPLDFNRRNVQEPPPQGVFPEQNLGPIMITLRSFFDSNGSGHGFF
ncbi:MAG: hypothetical protein NTV04_13675 [Deltaproteobacteria bacterium]|nr:hypothetical protein [Deltaproteobacteria bacterium]